jgi:hypothetical protein
MLCVDNYAKKLKKKQLHMNIILSFLMFMPQYMYLKSYSLDKIFFIDLNI